MIAPVNSNLNTGNACNDVLNTIMHSQSQGQFAPDLFKDMYLKVPTALPPKAHLVKGTSLSCPYNEIKQTAKGFFNALRGNAGDYELGKLNDPAIKLSSLGIAALLAAKAGSPAMKAMEFVGFGTWFLAMSIWPKLFIAKPIKALTGVDMSQEYVDSQGRRKRFYQDPQYLAWDLMSDKEIHKIGDKLKIPKNIENRREAIQDKVKQIATQANTLWMLTAGFSTPILSSLIADQLRVPIKKFIVTTNHNIAEFRLKAVSGTGNAIHSVVNKLFNTGSTVEEKLLQKLMDKGDAQGVEKLFAKTIDKLSTLEVKNAILEKLPEMTKNSNGQEILGHYRQLKSLVNTEKALNYFHRVTLKDGKGAFWIDDSMRMVKALKLPKALAKEFATCESTRQAEIIANHLKGLKPEELERVHQQTAKLAAGSVNNARNLYNRLSVFIKNQYSEALSSVLGKDKAKEIATQIKGELRYKLTNLDSAFGGIAHTVRKVKGATPEQVVKLVEGIKSPDSWAEFSEIIKTKGEAALKIRLKESVSNKSTLNKIVKAVKSGDVSKIEAINEWLSQTSRDLLVGGAKEIKAHKDWLKIVGLIGGGILLGITMLTILNMGKRNSYNLDVYKQKEAGK